MEIREYAEKVLFGTTLEDKLFWPEAFSDSHPHYLGKIPAFPSRPKKLSYQKVKESKKLLSIKDLENREQVAKLMHYFANHELLALEIMALVLLKFPDTPAAFRKGIVKEMGEEAEHLSLYIARMNLLGMEFGEVPLNRFFWNNLSKMESPIDFCVKMGMTFEQANLDFSKFYIEQLKTTGDLETQHILQKVYEDEISHVGFGLHWFKKFKNLTRKEDLFQAHKNSLVFPMGMQRAKAAGKYFDKEARRRAGFDETYIRSLDYFSSSKERPPVLRYFNPQVEEECLYASKIYTPKKLTKNIKTSLEHFLWSFSKKQDVILVDKAPSYCFLDQFKSLGWEYPEYLVCEPKNLESLLKTRSFHSFSPWGFGPSEFLFLEKHNEHFSKQVSTPSKEMIPRFHSQVYSLSVLKEFVEKAENKDLLVEKSSLPKCFDNSVEALNYAKTLKQFVVKAPLGLSGRGVFFFDNSDYQVVGNKIDEILKKQNHVIIETHRDRVADFSLQLEWSEEKQKYTYQIARFLSGDKGAYHGGLLGKAQWYDSGSELKKFWNDSGRSPNRLNGILKELCDTVGEAFTEKHYYEPLGIDCFIYRDEEGALKLRPLVEINARHNMGFIKTKLASKIAPKSFASYHVVPKKALLEELSEASFFDNYLSLLKTEKQKISRACFFVSDPFSEGDFVALLIVGDSKLSWLSLQKDFISSNFL